MPEGDTIFRAARTLNRALAGHVVIAFETQLAQLARVDYDAPIAGRTVESVDATGKWLRMYFSGDLILITHMLMSGSWHIYRPGERWKVRYAEMRVAIYTKDFVAVAFRVPIAEFHTAATLERHRSVQRLGPDVLAPEFDAADAERQLRTRPDLEVGVGLLRQSLISGMGNVFKSEVCFASEVNPFRLIGTLTADELQLLITNARKFMLQNVTETSNDSIVTYTGMRRTTGRANPSERLWVYKRDGEPCRRCGTVIVSRKQGLEARVTFWCPTCQISQAASP
ncbi:MAG TPA: DNA-formamidopyrimidine glycosylase family protein [Bryobacteraceae bacterium]|nr:DNA-formamidopyrimidine glycosylase family protein [Bryobacteraceae bacterium]